MFLEEDEDEEMEKKNDLKITVEKSNTDDDLSNNQELKKQAFERFLKSISNKSIKPILE